MAIYLDNASTTMVCPQAAQAALELMTENYGNPSSTHKMGRDAKKSLDKSRDIIASAIGAASPGEIVFTSCGTESDNWALISAARSMHRKGKHIISSQAEHSAVLHALDLLEAEGYEITRLAPDRAGNISPQQLQDAIREDSVLVSLMMVNNETGAVTDINAMSEVIQNSQSSALLHTDAVQGFLKLPFKSKSLGADLISISAHKVHGPKGVGALYIRKGLRLTPLIIGGGQEAGLRSGTEALPQIAAFAAAAQVCASDMTQSAERMAKLRQGVADRLTRELPGLIINGGGAGHILSLSLPGYKSEVLMSFLEAREIYVSKSSACKKGGRSHVLTAMGLANDVIDGTIRLGLSRYTTQEECDEFCRLLIEAHNSLISR